MKESAVMARIKLVTVQTFALVSSIAFHSLLGQAAIATPESDAFAHNKKGIELYKAGKVKEATEEVKKATELDPKNANYHRNLSSLYQAQNMMAEAQKEAELATKSKPGDSKSLGNMANTFLAQKKYAEAEKYYAQAIKAAPSNMEFRVDRAVCLLHLKKNAEFDKEIKEVLKKNPNNVRALALLSNYYLDQKKTDEAEKTARTAVKAAGKDPDTHLQLAKVLQARGKDKEAITEYKQVLTLKPDHPSASDIKKSMEYIDSKVDSRIP